MEQHGLDPGIVASTDKRHMRATQAWLVGMPGPIPPGLGSRCGKMCDIALVLQGVAFLTSRKKCLVLRKSAKLILKLIARKFAMH